jgi:hypothetical protein
MVSFFAVLFAALLLVDNSVLPDMRREAPPRYHVMTDE